jgi:hypothetical protein
MRESCWDDGSRKLEQGRSERGRENEEKRDEKRKIKTIAAHLIKK